MALLANTRYLLSAIQDLSRYFAEENKPRDWHAIVRARLQTRESRFLRQVKEQIYDVSWSPYRNLLTMAGCEFGDLEGMVRRQGLEETLRELFRSGVYLSFEEFRGRSDVVRGASRFRFRFEDFDNPRGRKLLQERTGGSRSVGLPVAMSLENVDERAPATYLALEALDALDKVSVIWLPGPRISYWLRAARLGPSVARWFCVRDPRDLVIGVRSRQFVTIARVFARLHGRHLPPPEHAPMEAAGNVLRAIVQASRRRSGCVVTTTPSLAVRLAGLARLEGISLERVSFLIGAEPVTPGKAAEIRATGARLGSLYAFSEGGTAGIPCGRPQEADDMHLLADVFAVIQRDREYAGVPVQSFVYTSLLASTPKIMLNVEMDDFGILERRHCGCPLEAVGLDLHVANVRSFTKLTGEGTTVLGTNCVQVIEEILPREFGGGSVDYQLLEAEDEHHLTRLFLLVSPRLGDVDEEAVRRRFIAALETSGGREGMPDVWRRAVTIQVLRREPVRTKSDKLFPFHTIALSSLEAH